MAYVPLSTVNNGDDIVISWGNQIRDNFAAGVPDIFTTKGDLALGTGADAAARLGIGTDYQLLQSLASQATGAQWSSGIYSLCAKSGVQSIATATMTKISVATAVSDPYSMLDGTNFRLTIPVGFPTRYYFVSAWGYFTAHATADKYRHIEVQVNGTAYVGVSSNQDDASEAVRLSTFGIVSLAATNYIEAHVKQNSGGNLNFNDTYLSLSMLR